MTFRMLACALLVGIAVGAAAGRAFPGESRPNRPNVVFILADDLGWTDLACYGSCYYETPHIDRLAAQGMRFTHGYTCGPNCQPTRAALASGQYGPRTGVYTVGGTDRFDTSMRPLVPVENVTRLAPEKATFAEALRQAGYATGLFGKWHLGEDPKHHPLAQGFDEAIVSMGRHFDFNTNPKVDVPPGAYLADFLTGRAIDFIERHKDRPFLVCLHHFAVHSPHQARPDKIAHFKDKPPTGGHTSPIYAGMIASVDQSVGRVVAKLDELKLSQDTLVIFSSDNGGVGGYIAAGIPTKEGITDNAPLRGGKGMLYEGGVRVPFIFRWPGRIKAGTVCEEPIISVDLFPTLAALSGAAAPKDEPLDGVNIQPLLESGGTAKLGRDALYWHFPGYLGSGPNIWRTTPAGAIRVGDYKLVEFFEDGRLELYNLREDVGQKHDLARERPELLRQLHAKLAAWRQEIQAPMPTPRAGVQDGKPAHQDKPKPAAKKPRRRAQSKTLDTGLTADPSQAPDVAMITVRPDDNRAELVNPGMGWVLHYYDNIPAHYGSKLAPSDTLDGWPGLAVIYLRIPWSYVEPEEGKFAWSVLDTPAQRWIAKGKQVAFRITASESWTRWATPQWVHDAGAKGYEFRSGRGVQARGPYWEPDFDDPVFLDKLDRFLAAMAARYDGSPEVAFLDVGSLGVWGEGHTWASTKRPISPATVKRHFDLHKKHFPRTLLAANDDMGGPEASGGSDVIEYAAAQGLTLRDDSILVQAGKRAYFHAAWAEPFWPKVPVILESEHYGPSKARGCWQDGSLYLNAVEDYHASYASIHWWPQEFLEENRELVRRINQRIGYRLQLVEASWPKAVRLGERLRIRSAWRNAGVAPCLPGGHPTWTLKDPKGGIVAALVDEGFDVRLLPVGPVDKAESRSRETDFALPFQLRPGTYDVFVAIGSRTGTPKIALPLADDDGQRRYRLGRIEVAGDVSGY